MKEEQLSFLIVRHDNIGDLVCVTPLIRALRKKFKHAKISVLANSYNAAVLENSHDIDDIGCYTKAKHCDSWRDVVKAYYHKLKLLVELRRRRFDYVILASPGFSPRALYMALMVNPRHIVGFVGEGERERSRYIDVPVQRRGGESLHEAQDVFRLLSPLDIHGEPPRVCISPDRQLQATVVSKLGVSSLRIGVHISSRKISQRWPARKYIEFIRRIHEKYDAEFLLFWSPGGEDNSFHPGDDAKALEIMQAVHDLPVKAFPTVHLGELIAGLSVCDKVVCSDGGAMHIAAGLGKPILCFFGKSSAARWHPWGVPYVLLQPESRDVEDVDMDCALSGFERLIQINLQQEMPEDSMPTANSQQPTANSQQPTSNNTIACGLGLEFVIA